MQLVKAAEELIDWAEQAYPALVEEVVSRGDLRSVWYSSLAFDIEPFSLARHRMKPGRQLHRRPSPGQESHPVEYRIDDLGKPVWFSVFDSDVGEAEKVGVLGRWDGYDVWVLLLRGGDILAIKFLGPRCWLEASPFFYSRCSMKLHGNTAVILVDGYDLELEQATSWTDRVLLAQDGTVLRVTRGEGAHANVLFGDSGGDSEATVVEQCLSTLGASGSHMVVLIYDEGVSEEGLLEMYLLDEQRCASLRGVDTDPSFWMNPAEHYAYRGCSGEEPVEVSLRVEHDLVVSSGRRDLAQRVVSGIRAGLPPGSNVVVAYARIDMVGLEDSLREGGYGSMGA